MSAITSVGSSTPIFSRPIQAAASSQPAKAQTTAPVQPIKSAGSDADGDGDSDHGGIDVAG